MQYYRLLALLILPVTMMGQQGTTVVSIVSHSPTNCYKFMRGSECRLLMACEDESKLSVKADDACVPAHPERKPAAKPKEDTPRLIWRHNSDEMAVDPAELSNWIEAHCRPEEKHTEATDCKGHVVTGPKQAICLAEVPARIRCNSR